MTILAQREQSSDSHLRGVLYFDVISPWAYLMDAALRREPLPIDLEPRPVLFAGLLNSFGHKGPAEIERKRRFTYEFCTWTAQQMNIPFQMPAVHPFNPLRYLRLIIGLGAQPEVVSVVFDALYTSGVDPDSETVWQRLLGKLGVTSEYSEMNTPAVKEQLKHNTADAASIGVFGIPTVVVANRLFWGADSLPMLRAYLRGDPSFDSPQMKAAAQVRFGAQR